MSVAWFGITRGYSLSNMNWLVGQSWLESARMANSNAQAYNNPFGMSRVYVRPTNQLGYIELSDGNTFGTYGSVFEAVKDRFDWDRYFEIRQKTYPKDVSKKYHESAQYEQSVSAVSTEGVGTAVGLLLGLVPFTFLIIKTIQ